MNLLTTSKVLAYLAIIFLAGGALGAAITLKNTGERQPKANSMETTCTRLQDRLTSKLGLSPEQVRKLQPLFDQTAQELRVVHSRALRDTDEIIRHAHERIATELNPEQKVKLELCDKERNEWLRNRIKDTAPATSH